MKHQIAELFMTGRTRNLPKGQVIIFEGDPADTLYYIIEGYVKVYSILHTGVERIINIEGPGDFFPLTSYLSGSGAVRYFYECMGDVKLQIISAEKLRDKIKGNFDFAQMLISYSNFKQQKFLQRINTLSVNNARRKVVALLAFLLEKTGEKTPISQLSITLTQQDIANMCALTRETTSAQLVRLRREGVISGAKKIVIDKPKLEKLKDKFDITD